VVVQPESPKTSYIHPHTRPHHQSALCSIRRLVLISFDGSLATPLNPTDMNQEKNKKKSKKVEQILGALFKRKNQEDKANLFNFF
jgi:hypothetical protein